MSRQRGLTVIEVLIIAIVLAILAAVVAPQLTRGSADTRVATMKANLLDVRAQIRLYRSQHANRFPTLANFAAQMTRLTDIEGRTATPSDQAGTAAQPGTAVPSTKLDPTSSPTVITGRALGPYLPSIPPNPYTGGSNIGKGPIGTSDWFYDERTGLFRANHGAAFINF
jgi:general secretion pathway protein G